MPPSVAIKTCLRKYATFTGRATRPEFWWFVLFLAVFTALLLVPATLVNTAMSNTGSQIAGDHHPLIWIVLIFCGIPLHSAAARRMNDMGWPSYLVFLPVVVFTAAFWGAHAISGSPDSPNYNGYASWGFSIAMMCAFFVSIGGVLAALIMPTRPSIKLNEVAQ